MTIVFSWQNSVSVCPASFCTGPNLPVIHVSLDPEVMDHPPSSVPGSGLLLGIQKVNKCGCFSGYTCTLFGCFGRARLDR